MKTESYNVEGMVEMLDVVSRNDSVSCNPYENFRFVAEASRQYEGPIEREVTYVSAAWNFVILFVVMILMVLNKFMSQQRLSAVISKPFQNGSDRAMRDNQTLFSPSTFFVIISFILMMSLLVQQIFLVYEENRMLHDNFPFFIDVAICVSAFLVFNYLLTSFYGWIFKSDSFTHLHFTLHISAIATSNLMLVPVILLLFFHPYKIFLIITLVILTLFFIATFIKLLIEVRMLSKLNFVNIFLYLCTVEILPVLVISKMIVNVL